MFRSAARFSISAKFEIPPLATTGAFVTAHTLLSNSRFGPARVPSLVTSVTT